ncbi:MAG: class I SAM-dependent methyltransferase [Candidatus Magasanikbacteria bacterium]|nr:class I SAM-dependent methyltransferase [Candidatus Magasanikbacteria bacterium]
MNKHLKQFVIEKFNKPRKSLDLGAGNFSDVEDLKKIGWKADGVDLKTGVDLEYLFESKDKPFDLVYSNYVIHKIKNKKEFIKTIYINLKKDGWFFVQTFDKLDVNSKSDLSNEYLQKIFKDAGFYNIKTKVFDFYDNTKGHNHWHKILEIFGQKK